MPDSSRLAAPPPRIETLLALRTAALSVIDAGADIPLDTSEIEVLLSAAGLEQPDCDEAWLRRSLDRGVDPLGDAYCRILNPDTRRGQGQTFTPPAIVESMVAAARIEADTNGAFVRIVDPGAGSGRFTIALARHFPDAELVAVERDPAVSVLLRANLHAAGLTPRARVLREDFRAIDLGEVPGRTLFVGNPPYVRHHDIGAEWKDWYAAAAASYGVRASKLAGLHLHFFVKALQLSRPGDFGLFVTAAEWMETGYGRALRDLLLGPMGGRSVHIVDAASRPFADALTTAAITGFGPHATCDGMRLSYVQSADDLADLSSGIDVAADVLQGASRWGRDLCDARPIDQHSPGDAVPIGTLFRVSRGQSTGQNDVWIAGPDTPLLPDRFLVPCITAAQDIFDAEATGWRIAKAGQLKRVIALPADLDALDPTERTAIDTFLDWARARGADKTYTARHRKPWWSVRLYPPAPIVCSYMARRAPVFVRNTVGAAILNIAHGLYPRYEPGEAELDQLCQTLNRSIRLEDGRTYAGGLVKFEPKMVENLKIERLSDRPSS